MANPLARNRQGTQAGNNLMATIQQMAQQGNPQQMAQQIIQQNPQFAQMLQGKSPQQMAMTLLQQNGINPQQIIQMFGGRK